MNNYRVLNEVTRAIPASESERVMEAVLNYLNEVGEGRQVLSSRAVLRYALGVTDPSWASRYNKVQEMSEVLLDQPLWFVRHLGLACLKKPVTLQSLQDYKTFVRSIGTYLKLEASIFYNQDGPTGRKYALGSVGTLSCAITYAALSHFMNDSD